MTLEEQQYPIGKWAIKNVENINILQQLSDLKEYTDQLVEITKNITETNLAKTYRNGGWNVRQLIHHLADTQNWHYIRLKHMLFDNGTKGYFGNVGELMNLPDVNDGIGDSLQMVQAIHNKYIATIKGLNSTQLEHFYYHSFRQTNLNVPQTLDLALWHLKHHFSHIKIALTT